MSLTVDIKDLATKSSAFKPGDVILLSDGTYANLAVKISCNGQSGNRITIKPQNPGKVILTGTSTITITGTYTTIANIVMKDGGVTSKAVIIQGSNNRVTGFDASYSNTTCEQMFRMEGKYHRVDHNIFHDWTNVGCWLVVWRAAMAEDFALIDHNIFKNRTTPGATNGLECIRVGTSTDSLTSSKSMIMFNKIINCNGEIECISNKSCDNIYYRNTVEACEGTLTLRHGDRCIVYANRFEQQHKPNSGGVRVTGESHIVANNLFRDINGNGTTRGGISINNGVVNTPLNGYYQVKNTKIKNNVFINCLDDFCVGVQVKSECVLKPITTEITGTIAYHADSNECFSTNSTCLGSTDMKFENNKFYAKVLGKVPNSSAGNQLLPPGDLNLGVLDDTFDVLYGCNEIAGPQWDIAPETTELTTPLDVFYNNLKTTIMTNMDAPVTQPVEPTPTQPVEPTPTQPIEPTQPTQPVEPTPIQPVEPTPTQPVEPTPTQPTVEPTQPTTTVTIDKAQLDKLLKIVQAATDLTAQIAYLVQLLQ